MAGCASYLAFKLLVIMSLAGFGLYRADQAGVELDVFLKQPALAAAAIGVMAHGDFEFVRLDKYRGTVTLRQTESGLTHTLRPEQLLRGDVLESGRTIGKLMGQDSAASEGPDWIPRYPGSRPRGVVGRVASFEAPAPARQVADYYDQALRDLGFEVARLSETPTITLRGVSHDGRREVTVVVMSLGTRSAIQITFAERC